MKTQNNTISIFKEHWEIIKDFSDKQKGQILTFIFSDVLPTDPEALITCKYIRNQMERIYEYKQKQAQHRKDAWTKLKNYNNEEYQQLTDKTYIGATKVGIGTSSPSPNPSPNPYILIQEKGEVLSKGNPPLSTELEETSGQVDTSVVSFRSGIEIPSLQESIIKTKSKGRSSKQIKYPTLTEVVDFVKEKGLKIDPEYFFKHFEERDWIDNNNNKVKNWKNKAITWSNRNKEKEEITIGKIY